MKKVLILTEGSKDIGFGHITRCTAIYQAFEEIGITPEFIVNGDESVKELLENKNHTVFPWLTENYSFEDVDLVVVDSYLANYTIYEKISRLVEIPVYLDDTKRIDYPDGIVVNGAIYAEEMGYVKKDGIVYLLGSQYTPLRKEFWDVSEKEIRENVGCVMVTFGGNDVRDMTPLVLKLLTDKYPEIVKKVVVGRGFQNIGAIESVRDDKTELNYFPDAEGMKHLMLESDVAISAGGQTLYELARVGVPTIGILVVDNQRNNVKGWQRAGVIEYAGWWEDEKLLPGIETSLELLKNSKLRDKMSKAGKSFIDGQGARRIARRIINKGNSPMVKLKRATMEDADDLFNWRNDPETIVNSFNTEPVQYETHIQWFKNSLSNPDRIILIGINESNEKVGMVRFDISYPEAEIHLNVTPDKRGRGYGKTLIQEGCKFMLENYRVEKIIARITSENTRSINVFSKAGFVISHKAEIVVMAWQIK